MCSDLFLSGWPVALLVLGGVGPIHSAEAQSVPFRFIIDDQDISGSDATCGPRQLSVNVFVNGVGEIRNLPGCTNPSACGSQAVNEVYEVNIPVAQASVPIVIDVSERDDPLCGGGDDHILTANLNADTRTGDITGGFTTFKSNGSPDQSFFLAAGARFVRGLDGFGVGFRIETTPAHVCSTWPAAFVDSGLGESVFSGLGLQRAPASFASVVLKDGTNVLTPAGQMLDAEGCLDVRTFARPGPGGWTLEQMSVLRRDGATIDVRRVAPAFRSQPPSNNFNEALKFANSSPLTVTIVVRPGPGNRVVARPDVSGLDQEDVARTAAVMGRMLRAGLKPPPGASVTAFAGDGCPSSGLQTDSCAPGATTFYVGPATGGDPPQSQAKFIVAHEFGHVLQAISAPGARGEGYPIINGLPDSCECRHVTVANKLHCLQSLELPGDVRKEGFAQFIAARTFNDVTDANPTFLYYKEMLVPTCPPGATCTPFNGQFRQLPPVPVSASRPALWRNRNCSGTPSLATEFDWMNFYWNVTLPGPGSVSLDQLFAVDRAQGTTIASNNAFLALAATVLPFAEAQAFLAAGDTFGVSTDTSRK